ncbi:MAG: hypothetical protein MJ201_05455 [Mycoplasmoidaceae bacterium]|nr:hypothetical protein [Mycoplasmoidaceae bacterium]
MKRKFILLPITLIALAPAICLVGCGDPDTPEPPEPEPVYQPYEIKWDGEYYKTDELTLLKDNYYKFWINGDHSLSGTVSFLFLSEREGYIHVDAYVSCVLVGGIKVQYNLKAGVGM